MSQDALAQLRDAGLARVGQALLGCEWGRAIATLDDQAECQKRAVLMVCFHDGDFECTVKLCEVHHQRSLLESTPRG